jgi:hypothetical protein
MLKGEPPTEHIKLDSRSLRATLLPRLVGTVFHVTRVSRFSDIARTGVIRANQDGSLGDTYPQSADGYGRAHGYVCLFDLRETSAEQVDDALDRLFFLDPFAYRREDPAFLFLSPSASERLVRWEAARQSRKMFIWHVEAWYPGDLSLALISGALLVGLERPPEGPHLKALRARS